MQLYYAYSMLRDSDIDWVQFKICNPLLGVEMCQSLMVIVWECQYHQWWNYYQSVLRIHLNDLETNSFYVYYQMQWSWRHNYHTYCKISICQIHNCNFQILLNNIWCAISMSYNAHFLFLYGIAPSRRIRILLSVFSAGSKHRAFLIECYRQTIC